MAAAVTIAGLAAGGMTLTRRFEHTVAAAPYADSVGNPAPAAFHPSAASTATAPPTTGHPIVVTYTIQSGDTIWDLAAKFGTTVGSITGSNGLSASGRIGPGQTIKIPTAPGLAVTVKSGQTLWGLAQQYGLKSDDIAKANGLDLETPLTVGSLLFLPGAKAVAAPITVASRGTSRGGTTASSSGSGSSSDSSPSASGFIWPVHGPVTSPFGRRNGSMHTGMDIAVPTGTPVHAAKAGTVIEAGWVSGYGYTVMIDHGDGVTTLYGHNSRLLVKKGQEVAQGYVIAYSGSTGHSTGPHVHFEIRIHDEPINPWTHLS
ncbi:MAG: peptidoglycan DD-metalloendopeptidase family protein [Bacillota bacterium]